MIVIFIMMIKISILTIIVKAFICSEGDDAGLEPPHAHRPCLALTTGLGIRSLGLGLGRLWFGVKGIA